MNYFELAGQATRWLSFKLKSIGFRNVKSYSQSNNEFRLLLKNGEQYVITVNKV